MMDKNGPKITNGPAMKLKGTNAASQAQGRGHAYRSGGHVPSSQPTRITASGGSNVPTGCCTASSMRSGGK